MLERAGHARSGVAARAALALEDRLARGERPAAVALRPGVGQGERRRLCHGGHEQLHLVLADRLVSGPERKLVDLVRELVEVLADQMDECCARIRLGASAGLLEALGDPVGDVALRHLEGQNVAGLGARLRQRRVLLQLLGNECQHGAGSRRGEVLLDRLHVGDLPAARETAVGVPPAVDALDHDEPRVAEQAADVAQRRGVRAGHLLSRDELDCLWLEVAAEARERSLDLGAIAAGEQVDGLQIRGGGHDLHPTQRPFRTVIRLPSDSTTTRPSSSVR